MCSRVDCPRCGQPGYRGCGAHVEQVLGNVPPAERCRCRESKETGPGAKATGPKVSSQRRSWLRSLLGD